MRGAHGHIAVTAAAIVSMALSSVARALEVEQIVGRWSGAEYDECVHPDDSEAAPLRIAHDADGTHIGNYGWLCTVKEWKMDGDFLVGSAKDCGQEGGDDTFDENFTLGLNARDELIFSKDGTAGLRRCPAVQ